MPRDPEVALLTPGAEVIQCSVCDEVIWSHVADPLTVRLPLPSNPWPSGETYGQAVMLMKQAADDLYMQTVVIPSEEACRAHMKKRHPLRLWLWERYGWDRVLRRWFR